MAQQFETTRPVSEEFHTLIYTFIPFSYPANFFCVNIHNKLLQIKHNYNFIQNFKILVSNK